MSSSSDNKRNMMYALGAGVALFSAAAVFYVMRSSGAGDVEVPELDTEEIIANLKRTKMGEKKMDQNGRIDVQYFLRML